MTDQHPLTDDMIRYDKKLGCHDLGAWIYTENDLRAATDWQLEQVTEWLKDNLRSSLYLEPVGHSSGIAIDVDYVIEDLREAMRPTTTTENKNA